MRNTIPCFVFQTFLHILQIQLKFNQNLVLPLNSIAIEPMTMLKNCADQKDLAKSMIFDPEREGQFRIFSKKKMRFLDNVWISPPFFQVHMIQAFQSGDKIHLDTSVSGSENIFDTFYYNVSKILNSLFLNFNYNKS